MFNRAKVEKTARFFDGILVIVIDGGVNAETAPRLKAAGATELITASYLFLQSDIRSAIKNLQ